jgi:hypothetical protein
MFSPILVCALPEKFSKIIFIVVSCRFRCCDLDGDGKLTPEEMRFFYRNQIHRITSLGQESINFQDVLCQMLDMVAPLDPFAITIEDLIRPDKRLISGKEKMFQFLFLIFF